MVDIYLFSIFISIDCVVTVITIRCKNVIAAVIGEFFTYHQRGGITTSIPTIWRETSYGIAKFGQGFVEWLSLALEKKQNGWVTFKTWKNAFQQICPFFLWCILRQYFVTSTANATHFYDSLVFCVCCTK